MPSVGLYKCWNAETGPSSRSSHPLQLSLFVTTLVGIISELIVGIRGHLVFQSANDRLPVSEASYYVQNAIRLLSHNSADSRRPGRLMCIFHEVFATPQHPLWRFIIPAILQDFADLATVPALEGKLERCFYFHVQCTMRKTGFPYTCGNTLLHSISLHVLLLSF